MSLEIATLLANHDILTLILNEDPEHSKRLRDMAIQSQGLLVHPDQALFLQAGSLEKEQNLISRADAIFECLPEQIEIKQKGYECIDRYIRDEALIFACNSPSLLSDYHGIVSEKLKSRLQKVHFSLPVRSHSAIELMFSPDGAKDASIARDFFQRRLGRIPVVCSDGGGPMVERLEAQFLRQLVSIMSKGLATIEEIEFFAGPILGFPAGGGLGKIDAMGLETFSDILRNNARLYANEADMWTVPSMLDSMQSLDFKGGRSHPGFYMRDKENVLCFRQDQMKHTPYKRVDLDRIADCLEIESFHARIRALLKSPGHFGELVWRILGHLMSYSMKVFPGTCSTTFEFDTLVREGLGFYMGPFELWDALGFKDILRKIDTDQVFQPEWMQTLREDEDPGFLRVDNPRWIECIDGSGSRVQMDAPPLQMSNVKRHSETIETNAHGSLYDLGDGVLTLELNSPKNIITSSFMDLLNTSINKANKEAVGLVIAVEGKNFSAGTDYAVLLFLARQNKYEEIRSLIRKRQSLNFMLKYSSVPIVCALNGLTLGAGLELAWHCTQIHGETNCMMGFDEMSRGLIPHGGACKEIIMRSSREKENLEAMERELVEYFELIVSGKSSSSFTHARKMKLVGPMDTESKSRYTHLHLAKSEVLRLYTFGYAPPQENALVTVPGRQSLARFEQAILLWEKTKQINVVGAHVARRLAQVLVGGQVTHPSKMSEEALLELETEMTLSLLGEEETRSLLEKSMKGERA